jgi:hypothetical protein
VPFPHVLSLDIQGEDYAALIGGQSLLRNDNLLCVIAEAPLRPIYEGQGTYADIDILLRKYGFHFAEFTHTQVWWEEIIVGKGFLGVTEAMFFRNYETVEKAENLARLGVLAHLFSHHWYGHKIASRIVDKFPDEVATFEKEEYPIWMHLRDMQRGMTRPVNEFRARVDAIGPKREWS